MIDNKTKSYRNAQTNNNQVTKQVHFAMEGPSTQVKELKDEPERDPEEEYLREEEARLFALQGERKYKCQLCTEEHSLENCDKFLKMDHRQRWTYLGGSCFNCLRPGHMSTKCRAKPHCKCGKKHHQLLHPTVRTGQKPSSEKESGMYHMEEVEDHLEHQEDSEDGSQ